MFRYSRIQFALVVCVSFAALAMHARADEVTPALIEAAKQIEQGVPVKAVEILNRTLKSGQIPPELASKALLLRARAHEALDKYAYALADYNKALWMKGLSASDKGQAEAGRSRIMAKLGVGDEPVVAQPAKAAPSQQVARAPQREPTEDTAVQTQVSEQRTGGTGGIGGFFGRIFGSSSEKAEQSPEPQTPARPTIQRVAAEVPRTPTAPAKPRLDQQAALQSKVSQASDAAPASVSNVTGEFAIQIAALHSEDKAIFEVNRVEKRFSEWLGGRTPSIKVRETADGGTLYKVVIEPYQRGEGVATCEMLKTKGLSCMLISR
jgi:hypothetical protein